MPLEVELKFCVEDPAGLVAQLRRLSAEVHGSVLQTDTYFAHPSRDFAATDEALRLRAVSEVNAAERTNQHVCVTYKGPRIGTGAKTREEIELPLPQGDATYVAWTQLLAALGFRKVREVVKTRSAYHLLSDGRPLEVCIDEVTGLGTFAEIETIAENAELQAAENTVAELASRLGLREAESRSYLEMLLES